MKQSPQFCLFAARIVNTRRLPNKAKAVASFIPDPVLFYYRHRGAFFSCSPSLWFIQFRTFIDILSFENLIQVHDLCQAEFLRQSAGR
jgi:hypothetical protein